MKRKNKRRKYIIAAKYIGLTVLGIYLCIIGMKQSYLERGYFAYGGECLLLFLPLIYYAAEDTIKGVIEVFKEVKETGKKKGT